jgi:CheY-like chemotaxis protein
MPDFATKTSRRIFVVDDNEADAMLYEHVLRGAGFEVAGIFGDGLDALNAIFAATPDAVVLDLDLPRLRGEEVCRLIRTAAPRTDLPVIIISELPDPKRREMELLRIGANAYLEKPFLEDDLIAALNASFRLPRAPDLASADSLAATGPIEPGASLADTPPAARRPAGAAPACLYDGYEIIDIVGAGGMGTVYRARQLALDRVVALKVLMESLSHDAEVRARFRREAKIMARLSHPNIVTVFDAGGTDYSVYIAMELIEGTDVGHLTAERAVTRDEALRILPAVGAALDYLHGRAIVHRDLKPSNILLGRDGSIKVGDFGISSIHGASAAMAAGVDERDSRLVFTGTWGFVPPEAMNRESEAPHPMHDIFAFGRTVWAMFAGHRRPRLGEPLNGLMPALPAEFCECVARAMDERAERRWATAGAFAAAACAALAG